MLVAALIAPWCAWAADPPVNALWNDGEGFGIWLYGRPGSCSEFKYANPPFVVLGNGGKRADVKDATLSARNLEVCLLVGKPDIVACTGGSVSIKYVPAANEFVGKYDLRLSDGSRWSGSFRAQYCKSPPRNP